MNETELIEEISALFNRIYMAEEHFLVSSWFSGEPKK